MSYNNVNTCDDKKYFKVLHSNCRGVESKIKSIETIADSLLPDVITLNEINLKKNKLLQLKGYKSFNRNRVNGNMGGISTSVSNADVESFLKVTDGDDDNEYIITRHSQFVKPINIINVYGDVESRTTKDVIDLKWDTIIQEVIKIEAREEHVLLIGDMNKHIGSFIKGNHDKITPGGRRVVEFVASGDYVILNGSNKEINGPFTRYDPSSPFDE